MKWLLILCLMGCTIPMKKSLRPRGVDIYAETAQSDYGPRSKFKDYRFGANVHWDIYYVDEEE